MAVKTSISQHFASTSASKSLKRFRKIFVFLWTNKNHSARAQCLRLEGDQLDDFIKEKFRSVITGEKVNINGDSEFTLQWVHEGRILCRKSYAFLFNIPKNKFDKCSSLMKAAGTQFINSMQHTPWKDDHVHDFTFAETEKKFKENIAGMTVVGIIISF